MNYLIYYMIRYAGIHDNIVLPVNAVQQERGDNTRHITIGEILRLKTLISDSHKCTVADVIFCNMMCLETKV